MSLTTPTTLTRRTRRPSPLATTLDQARPVTDDIPCRTHDSELWYSKAEARIERAKYLCQSCPVQQACLSAAMDMNERHGVWGGTDPHQRRALRRAAEIIQESAA